MSEVKAFTYWETSPFRPNVLPYIICGIVSMKRALGDRFVLITPANLQEHVDFDFSTKDFYFAGIPDKEKNSISRITAKSDFVRFKRILDHGGIWMDADTIVLREFFSVLDPLLSSSKLIWHSEQFFGAQPNNPMVRKAVDNMLQSQRQHFANPGKIKDMLSSCSGDSLTPIPRNYIDPTGDRSYTHKDWEVASRQDVSLGGGPAESAVQNRKVVQFHVED